MKWCFALDHHNHVKWLSVHLLDLVCQIRIFQTWHSTKYTNRITNTSKVLVVIQWELCGAELAKRERIFHVQSRNIYLSFIYLAAIVTNVTFSEEICQTLISTIFTFWERPTYSGEDINRCYY